MVLIKKKKRNLFLHNPQENKKRKLENIFFLVEKLENYLKVFFIFHLFKSS